MGIANLCPLCGSDDLQKSDDLMARFPAVLQAKGYDAARGEIAEPASALRRPHMNGRCRVLYVSEDGGEEMRTTVGEIEEACGFDDAIVAALRRIAIGSAVERVEGFTYRVAEARS